MGTRSFIGVMHGDVCKVVYCHWDGYLSHNGRILQEHYDSAKANHLVALGDISSLKKDIGEKHPFSPLDMPDEFRNMTQGQYETAYGNMTTFYGRDRGELGCEFRSIMNFESLLELFDNTGAEFCYIMKDGVWYMFDGNNRTLRELSTELENQKV